MSEDLKPIVPEQQEEALEQSVVNAEQVAEIPGDISQKEIVQPEKAVEEAPKAKAPKKAPKAKVAEETSEAAVAEDAPKAEVAEETSEAAVAEDAPKAEVAEETPKAKAPKKAPKAKVAEETSEAAVAEDAPKAEAVEETPKVEVAEETSKAEPIEEAPEVPDYSEMGLKELLDLFQMLLDRGDMQLLYKHADSIKAIFYKTLRKEKIASGFIAPSEDVISDGTESGEVVSINPFAEVERGFKELYTNYRTLRNAYAREQEQNKEQNLQKKLDIIEQIKALVERQSQEDMGQLFSEFGELQAQWRATGQVPQARMRDLYESYSHNVEIFYDNVKIHKELRDLDFKRNLTAKEELCVKAEALAETEYDNIVAAFKALQKLHEEWKEIGPVGKEHRESIWERFKAATAIINKKHQAYFDSLKQSQRENFEAKSALCEEVEKIVAMEISDSRTWNKMTKAIEEIQAKWKAIGFASKKDNVRVYDRFRAACDQFFEAKKAYYAQLKEQMQENLKLKIDLCEKAEAVQHSEEWKKTTDYLIDLQKQWKEIGPVSRKRTDQVWKRFRAACDVFFNNKEKHFGKQESQYEANRQLKLALIEEIKAFELSDNKGENFEALKTFQSRWNEIGFVPFKEKNKLQDAFKKAIDAKFDEVRSQNDDYRPRYGKYSSDSNLSKAERGLRTERDRLVQKYVKKEQDIATWENNMGFFSKTKNAETYLAKMRKEIEVAREELAQLEDKIKAIDSQFEQRDE
jgi:flagellin-specific chaperone FliS